MTQAICDITTDEVNVDVVVEPQADTMVEVANRAGGMEQVFHDNTLIGNGNSVDLGVNTDIIATKEYVDENKVDAYTKTEVDNKFTVANAQIDANATAIQKTRDDMNEEDGRLQTQITAHAAAITALQNEQTATGNQIQTIESKIPDGTSDTNPLINKQQLLDTEMNIREDVDSADSDLQTQINGLSPVVAENKSNISTLRTDVDDLGDQVSGIEEKIPASASATNQLATLADLSIGFDVSVVAELPATGQKGIVYLLAKDGAAPDVYDEYVWIESTQTFELIGTTQVDLTGYVKDTDYATSSKGGVIRTNSTYGTWSGSNGLLSIVKAPDETILEKTHLYQPIVPASLDYAVKVGVTTNTIELTDEEKETAQTWLGVAETVATKVDKDQGTDNVGKILSVGPDGQVTLTSAPGGGLTAVAHDSSLTGAGTDESPLGIASTVLAEIADKAEQTTVETLSGVVSQNTTNIGTLRTDVDDLGDQVSGVEGKIPESTSTTNQLVNATQLSEAIAEFDALPDQTGNANRFLVTNGETTSWSLGVIEYKTGNDYNPASLFISDSSNSNASIANVKGSVRIGGNYFAQPGNKHYNTIIGIKAYAHNNAVAIGYKAAATGDYSIQLGTGTNNDANTFKVANANGNFEMMSADGTIPAERISTTVGTTGQVLTKTDTGMAWAEAPAGGTKVIIKRYE